MEKNPKKRLPSVTVQVKSWLYWLAILIPLMTVYTLASHRFGTYAALPFMLGLLVLTLLYQRYVKGRSWRSIMFGIYGRVE
ncbi:MAG: hypothetical protein P8Y58_07690 [Novosphingobium sp.]